MGRHDSPKWYDGYDTTQFTSKNLPWLCPSDHQQGQNYKLRRSRIKMIHEEAWLKIEGGDRTKDTNEVFMAKARPHPRRFSKPFGSGSTTANHSQHGSGPRSTGDYYRQFKGKAPHNFTKTVIIILSKMTNATTVGRRDTRNEIVQ